MVLVGGALNAEIEQVSRGRGGEEERTCAAVRNKPKKILGYPSFASNYAGRRSKIKGGRARAQARAAAPPRQRGLRSKQKLNRVRCKGHWWKSRNPQYDVKVKGVMYSMCH